MRKEMPPHLRALVSTYGAGYNDLAELRHQLRLGHLLESRLQMNHKLAYQSLSKRTGLVAPLCFDAAWGDMQEWQYFKYKDLDRSWTEGTREARALLPGSKEEQKADGKHVRMLNDNLQLATRYDAVGRLWIDKNYAAQPAVQKRIQRCVKRHGPDVGENWQRALQRMYRDPKVFQQLQKDGLVQDPGWVNCAWQGYVLSNVRDRSPLTK